MAITRAWKVYGNEGHRQRMSFDASKVYDFSEDEYTKAKGYGTRIIELECADKTGTNEYVIMRITCDTAEQCEAEMLGQISDGFFENSRVGKIEEVTP